MTDLRERLAGIIDDHTHRSCLEAADAIIAALPGMVQPLVWNFDEDMPAYMDAIGCGHLYRVIRRQSGKGSLRIDRMWCEHSEHADEEAAKAAACAHNVATIMQAFGVQGGEA